MLKKNTYRLFNPYIEGTADTVVQANNSFNAGKKLYNGISSHFTNHLEDFYMTIQNVQTKELTHFKITEKINEDGTVDFKLDKIDGKFTPEIDKKLIAAVNNIGKQTGGKHHKKKSDDSSDSSSSDSSNSDSSSDSECYKFPLQPINRFVYFYLPYYKLNLVGLSPIDISRLFMPTFGFSPNPTIEIRMDLYKYF